MPKFEWPDSCRNTIKTKGPVSAADLALAHKRDSISVACRTIVIGFPKTLEIDNLPVVDGKVFPSIAKDRLAVAVMDRHQGSGNIGKGFVTGIGPRQGAIASSINHNCHHLFAVGADFDDMATALNRLVEIRGGYVAVADGRIISEIALPVIGMISDLSVGDLSMEFTRFEDVIRRVLGWKPEKRPLYVLNFLCSPVVPRYGFTDKGLVDSHELCLLDVVVDTAEAAT